MLPVAGTWKKRGMSVQSLESWNSSNQHCPSAIGMTSSPLHAPPTAATADRATEDCETLMTVATRLSTVASALACAALVAGSYQSAVATKGWAS